MLGAEEEAASFSQVLCSLQWLLVCKKKKVTQCTDIYRHNYLAIFFDYFYLSVKTALKKTPMHSIQQFELQDFTGKKSHNASGARGQMKE